MKPSDWEELSNKESDEYARKLANSIRGKLIIGQALVRAIEVMSTESRPETSNIQDMEILQEVLFPLYGAIQKANMEFNQQHNISVT